MVALKRPREHRHYPMGPIHQDRPLRVYSEDAEDLNENIARLRVAKSWWPERLLMVLVGIVFSIWMWRG